MRLFFVICALVIVVFPVQAKPATTGKAPVVRPLGRHLDDVGCAYVVRTAPLEAYPVMLSTPDGTWMNIDGKERALTLVEKSGSEDQAEYRAGEYRIILKYGPMKQHEAGVGYSRAVIMVIYKDQKTIIKVEGGCAC